LIAALVFGSCAHPASLLFPQPRADTRIAFAIATWNMHAGRGDLPRFIDDLASGKLTGTPPGEYIALLQEDVENTDEGTGASMFAAAHGLAAFFAPVRVNGAGASGNAIVSTLALDNPLKIALRRERQPRAAAMAWITVAGETLFVVNVHLENRVIWWRGLFSDNARSRQAAGLLQALPSHGHGVLGGDLNTWLGPGEAAWRAMAGRFSDTPGDKPEPTFHDRLVLDHLFFDLPDGWLAVRRVIPDAYGSDHHPVVAVVEKGVETPRP
jgi:endonuclease/exonuclease/phosphatase family metal-dependent hydrolase